MRTRTLITLLALLGWLLAFSIPNAASAEADKATRNPAPTSTEESKGAYLGLALGPVHPSLAIHLSDVIGKGRGVLVTDVAADSPAHKAGIKIHDILVTYDKQDLYSAEQLVKLVQNDKPDRDVVIGFVHKGALQETKVHLQPMSAKESRRNHTAFRLPFDDFLPFERFGWTDKGRRRNVTFKEETASPWTSFESMTLRKLEDDRFEASIEYRDQKGKTIAREFSGTRDEIRQSIEKDKDLPDAARDHLLRGLDQRSPFDMLPRAIESLSQFRAPARREEVSSF